MSVPCGTGTDAGNLRPVCVLLQVLGLTSYSHWEEAVEVRRCAQESGPAEDLLASLAVKKLKGFVHVGLMERLDDSIAALAVSPT